MKVTQANYRVWKFGLGSISKEPRFSAFVQPHTPEGHNIFPQVAKAHLARFEGRGGKEEKTYSLKIKIQIL